MIRKRFQWVWELVWLLTCSLCVAGAALGDYQPDPGPVYSPGQQPAYQAHTYRGLIGAHTSLSDGQGSVSEWARAAQAKGYDFLVFTETFPSLTEAKWKELVAACAQASAERFLCIPGMAYQDNDGNHYITFGDAKWPKPEWLNKAGDRISDTPGLYVGNDRAPLAVIDTSHNPTGPWFLKFYGALSVYTYQVNAGKCRCIDDATGLYLDRMANQYNSVPIAYHAMYHPEDLTVASGYVNCAWAQDLPHVATHSFRHIGYAQPQGNYLSEGPRLKEWWVGNGTATVEGESAHGVPDHWEKPWTLHLSLDADAPLRTVTIYDGTQVFRRFAPHSATFRTVLTGMHDRQRYFVISAEDTQGRRLLSPTLRTADSRNSIFMSADMQNTIQGSVQRDHNGHWNFIDVGVYRTGGDGLSIGLSEPGDQKAPSGLDYPGLGFGGAVSHSISTEQGSESAIARRNLAFGSGDCVILDSDFSTTLSGSDTAPTRFARTFARYITYTPRIYSHSLMLLERETVLKETTHLSATPPLDLQVLSVSGNNASFANYAYLDTDATLRSGKRPTPEGVVAEDTVLQTGGYAALYPDLYGSVGVFPLQSDMCLPQSDWQPIQLHLALKGAQMRFGYHLPEQTLPAGTRFRQTFLIMRAKSGERDGDCFSQVRRAFGLDGGKPAYSVRPELGWISNTRYTLDVAAKNGAAIVDLSRADLPCDLPMRISGLNPKWSAVCVELPITPGVRNASPGALPQRAMGVCKDVGYMTEDINTRGRRLFLGHPALCDSPDVLLNVTDWSAKGLTVEVHNPTARPLRVRVSLHPKLGAATLTIRVPAETSETVLLPWTVAGLTDAHESPEQAAV